MTKNDDMNDDKSATGGEARSIGTDISEAGGRRKVRLLNRERAILAFNRRVLAQARRADVPLLERLRYICIVSSNMDEFFEVRFADALEAASDPDSGTTHGELALAAEEAHALIDEQYALFNDELMPALAREGIVLLNHAERNEAQRAVGLRWSPVQYMYKQWAGLYETERQKLYVNRGFGFIGYPGRVGILPEITLIELA